MDSKPTSDHISGVPQPTHLSPTRQRPTDARYSLVPNAEDGRQKPEGLTLNSLNSSPAISSIGSPQTPFKDMTEVRRYDEMREKDSLLKRRVRHARFFLRLASLILAFYMIITMSLTFNKFFSTRNSQTNVQMDPTGATPPVRRGPWAKESVTWPTTVLLACSVVSFVISAAVMAAYLRGVRAANIASDYGTYITWAVIATHSGMWIAVAVAYRLGKARSDLWGWTCQTDVQDDLQGFFDDVIDFRRYCDIQTSSWATSVIEAIVVLLYAAVYLFEYVRLQGRREMTRTFTGAYEHRESRWSKMVPSLPARQG